MTQTLRELFAERRHAPDMPREFEPTTRDRFCPSCITRKFVQQMVNPLFVKRLPRRVRQAYMARCEREGGVIWRPDACFLCAPRHW